MPSSTPTTATTPRIKRKQSWMGSVIRSVVTQGALTAKAAVDAVRQRIDPPTPLLVDKPNSTDISPEQTTPKPRHKKSQSVRSTFSSIRARLPHRSLDHRQHSIPDLRADSRNSTSEIPGCIYISPKRRGLAILAAQIPLPSSPIDVPVKAPSLSLDLGPRQLMTPHPEHRVEIPASPKSTSTDMTSLRLPTPLISLQEAMANMIPDPLQPVAEVRARAGQCAEGCQCRSCGRAWPMIDSPLPGVNTTLEIDSPATPTHPPANNNTILVIGDISRPSVKNASTQTTFLQKLESLASAETDDKHKVEKVEETAKVFKIERRPLINAAVPVANSGPPSPDRPVRLVLRPKPSIDSVLQAPVLRKTDSLRDGMHQAYSGASSSMNSLPDMPRASPARYHRPARSIPDMTASILRERTEDHLQHPERFAAVTSDKLQGIDVLPISQKDNSGSHSVANHSFRPSPVSSSKSDQPISADEDQQAQNVKPAASSSPTELLIDAFTHRLRMATSSPSPLTNRFETYNRFAMLRDLDDSSSDASFSELPTPYHYGC